MAADIAAHSGKVRWQSGDAEDCKSSNAGSIPARTSNPFAGLRRQPSFQPIQSHSASPMTRSRSRPASHGSSSVNIVTHWR